MTPFNHENKDIRLIKIKIVLNTALFALLKRQNFRKITVKEICEEASISRVSFYAHYSDKYDLLKDCLKNLTINSLRISDGYEKVSSDINSFVKENKKVIENIIDNNDDETLEILFDFMCEFLEISIDKYDGKKEKNSKKTNPEHIVSSNFFCGGIIYYILQHLKNKCEGELMNIYLYEIIKKFKEKELQ